MSLLSVVLLDVVGETLRNVHDPIRFRRLHTADDVAWIDFCGLYPYHHLDAFSSTNDFSLCGKATCLDDSFPFLDVGLIYRQMETAPHEVGAYVPELLPLPSA